MALTAKNARKQYSKLGSSARGRYQRAANSRKNRKLNNPSRHYAGMKAAGSSGG